MTQTVGIDQKEINHGTGDSEVNGEQQRAAPASLRGDRWGHVCEGGGSHENQKVGCPQTIGIFP